MIWRNLWRRKTRTLLTMTGIAIGIGVVVALLVMAEALAGQFSAIMEKSGAEVTVMQSGIADLSFSALEEEIGERMEILPRVDWVSGLLLQIVPVEKKPFFILIGIDPAGAGVDHFRVVEGNWLAGGGEVMLGRISAGVLAKKPGDAITIQGQDFRVAGIYETGVGFEDGGGVMALSEAQVLFKKPEQVSLYQVKVRVEALDEVEALIGDIQVRFPGVTAYRSSEFGRSVPDIKSFQALAGAISMIGLLAGGLGTMNTMLMSVFERRREIGTLRALGWRKRQVLGVILGEALTLGLFGGLLGVGAGAGLVALLNLSPVFTGVLEIGLTPGTFLTALGVALGLGALGGLYPAWRASRLLPAEALRYE